MARTLEITQIAPTPRDPKRLHIRVNNKAAATLPASLVEALGLAVGLEWDAALAARVDEAVLYDKALRRAARQIDRRPHTAARMEAKLQTWGYAAEIIERVMRRLKELGLIDDEAMGRALIEEWTAPGPGPAPAPGRGRGPIGPELLKAKLEQRGIAAPIVEKLVESAAPSSRAAARELAEAKLATMAQLDPVTRQRRLWSLLGRRGFDQETIEAALDGLPGLDALE